MQRCARPFTYSEVLQRVPDTPSSSTHTASNMTTISRQNQTIAPLKRSTTGSLQPLVSKPRPIPAREPPRSSAKVVPMATSKGSEQNTERTYPCTPPASVPQLSSSPRSSSGGALVVRPPGLAGLVDFYNVEGVHLLPLLDHTHGTSPRVWGQQISAHTNATPMNPTHGQEDGGLPSLPTHVREEEFECEFEQLGKSMRQTQEDSFTIVQPDGSIINVAEDGDYLLLDLPNDIEEDEEAGGDYVWLQHAGAR
eukprot:comp6631_c0_seq1/m.2402 comp6631_c0_seq1/g.2402  ORF comp6631_c0_seq1/g.2402 comp6631_c0_seq1/m.2402 type:complete len:252 (-) comp6631_c0_seq1:155-910(-)